jgi:uncharacterized membrane-anchored protein YitT (DUF2179 family)
LICVKGIETLESQNGGNLIAVPSMPAIAASLRHHRPYEDIQALLTGCLFVALAVTLFVHAGLLSGGTTGIAFLIHYATGINFGIVFFLVNVPFYALAWYRMGRAFTLKTLASVSLLSLLTSVLPMGLKFAELSPWLAAVLGGLLCGTGMLILFRHQASLGGLNVLVLYLQAKRGWRAGKIQMLLDGVIILIALFIVPWDRVALSVFAAIMVNTALAINHRPERYMP